MKLTAANEEIRSQNVSASEVGALMGDHPYMTPEAIWDRLCSPFALERVTTTLDTVKVAAPSLPARFGEFESRLKNHQATAAFTRDDILTVNPVDTWQMLSRVPSVKLIPNGATGGMLAASNRGQVKGALCYMNLMIDGVMFAGSDVSKLPPPDQIHGLEVFAGPASLPPQYSGAGKGKWCGLIAVWTR